MHFVTIEYDREARRWAACGDNPNTDQVFSDAEEQAGLRWESLDVMQKYCFKVIYTPQDKVEGLRFLGVETRWGEYVAATKDQLVLRNPS